MPQRRNEEEAFFFSQTKGDEDGNGCSVAASLWPSINDVRKVFEIVNHQKLQLISNDCPQNWEFVNPFSRQTSYMDGPL